VLHPRFKKTPRPITLRTEGGSSWPLGCFSLFSCPSIMFGRVALSLNVPCVTNYIVFSDLPPVSFDRTPIWTSFFADAPRVSPLQLTMSTLFFVFLLELPFGDGYLLLASFSPFPPPFG